MKKRTYLTAGNILIKKQVANIHTLRNLVSYFYFWSVLTSVLYSVLTHASFGASLSLLSVEYYYEQCRGLLQDHVKRLFVILQELKVKFFKSIFSEFIQISQNCCHVCYIR